MPERKKQSVLSGAFILTVAILLVKIIGVMFKIPLTSLIGGVGRGYFNSAYELYTPLYAISMAGLPIAVARLVSENMALGRFREARGYFATARRLFFIIGVAGTGVMLIIAYPYTHFIADSRNLLAVIAISPSIFFCCVMSSYRGYYEGTRNFSPTAVSEVIEASGKLLLGLGAAYVIMRAGLSEFRADATVFGTAAKDMSEAYSLIYPKAAAGAISGVTFGTLMGAVYLNIRYRLKGDEITRLEIKSSPAASDPRQRVRTLGKVALPMVIGALVQNITNIIDTVTIQNRLAYALAQDASVVKQMHQASIEQASILDKDLVKYLWGIYGSSIDFRNMIPAITMTLGVSAIPALAAAHAIQDRKGAKSTIETVLRITMLIALPAGIGLGVLAKPVLTLIYGGGDNPDIIAAAAPIVSVYGFATALIAMSTPLINMLQAIRRADIPVKSLAIGALCKIISNYILVGTPKYNIRGAPAGSILCYLIIVSINLIALIRLSGVRPSFKTVLLKPLASAALCGLAAWTAYGFLSGVLPAGTGIMTGGNLAALAAMALAAAVYAVCLLLTRSVLAEDIAVIPKGKNIAKVLEKYGLLG